MEKYSIPQLENVKVNGDFWKEKMELIAEKTIPYQWRALHSQEGSDNDKSYAFLNLEIASGQKKGVFQGPLFQDSDIGKWIEAASYTFLYHPSDMVEGWIDGTVDLLEAVQLADGYLDSYYIAGRMEERYTNFAWGHELYCCGHLIEGAIAYYKATGKEKLLNISEKYLDNLMSKIGHGEGKLPAYSGHPEIEIALMKLYHETGEKKYLDFCKYLIEERGRDPKYFESEKGFASEGDLKWMGLDYSLSHKPFRQQKNAVGHAVRAVYLYAGAADLAGETEDEELKNVLCRIWKNTTGQKVYITAGLGAHSYGERFSIDYDLPNDTCYTETCASIGFAMWGRRMQALEINSEYGAWTERALYNGILSGISVDGCQYFYVNPLEVIPEKVHYRYDLKHIRTRRSDWYGCCCCPPNLARLIASVGQFIYGFTSSGIFIHQYIGSETAFSTEGHFCRIQMESQFPWEGYNSIQIEGDAPFQKKVYLRIPEWASHWQLKINGKAVQPDETVNGYICIERKWQKDRIEIDFPMISRLVYPNRSVADDASCVAVQRGPVIYCAEEADNGKEIYNFKVQDGCVFEETWENEMGGYVGICIRNGLKREDEREKLYSFEKPSWKEQPIKLIPYYLWANRQEGEMRVWLNYTE